MRDEFTPLLIVSFLALLAVVTACGASDEPPTQEPVVIITDDTQDETTEPTEKPQTHEQEEDEQEEEQQDEHAGEAEEGAQDQEDEMVELEPRTASSTVWSEGLNCDVACSERGWLCDVNEERLGTATYTKTTENANGSFTTRDTLYLETCEQAIPEQYDQYDTYDFHDFERYRCPCLAEPITRITVPAEELVTCDEACAGEGLACHAETPWTLGQESGGEAYYQTDDASRYHPVGCSQLPSQEISRGGKIYSLVELRCGCQ